MTTKSKTQLRGHCQCCGREQAVRRVATDGVSFVAHPRSFVAHHGYTVEHRYFKGPCPGHKYAPIEECRETADRVVASVRREVAGLRLEAERTLAGLADPETYKGHLGQIHVFADANEYIQSGWRKSTADDLNHRAKAGEQIADFISKLVEKVHGQPLIVVKKSEPAPYIQRGDRRAVGEAVYVCNYQDGGKVYFHLEKDGPTSRDYTTSSRAWRLLPVADKK